MNDTQLGTLFRAARIHRGWRQSDIARLAGTSQASISRIERGHVATLPMTIVRSVARVLEIRVDVGASWRGGDGVRLINARHTAIHEALARRLQDAPAWESVAEVSFSTFGERGVIDRLGFHRARGMLAIFEIKSDLADPAGLVGQMDRYRRLAPGIARDLRWDVGRVSCWAILADSSVNRRRVTSYRGLLRGAFPANGHALKAWLRDPDTVVNGLAFMAYPPVGSGSRKLTSVKRVRLPRSRRAERG